MKAFFRVGEKTQRCIKLAQKKKKPGLFILLKISLLRQGNVQGERDADEWERAQEIQDALRRLKFQECS